MPTLKYDGRDFPLVEKPLYAEIDWVEKAAKADYYEASNVMTSAMHALITLRRNQIMLTWADVMGSEVGTFYIEADPDPEPDPTAAGEEPGPPEDGSLTSETGTGSPS